MLESIVLTPSGRARKIDIANMIDTEQLRQRLATEPKEKSIIRVPLTTWDRRFSCVESRAKLENWIKR